MGRVYLIRHGWSEGNENKRFCGWTDVELTDKGRSQIDTLGNHPFSPKPVKLYASPLKRAYESAMRLATYWNSEIERVPAFKEIHFGAFEDRSWENISEKYPSQAELWAAGGVEGRPPGGESVEDLAGRVLVAFHQCRETMGEQPWGLVAHGGVIQAILAQEIAGNLEAYWHFSVQHGGITCLEYSPEGYGVLKSLNGLP